MPTIITDTAQMMCNKGAAPAVLKVTSQSYVYIEDKLVATEQDKAANTNIPPFGVCAITQKPCMPKPTAWQDTTVLDAIGSDKELTDESYCMCGVGGKISFVSTGQNGFATNEK